MTRMIPVSFLVDFYGPDTIAKDLNVPPIFVILMIFLPLFHQTEGDLTIMVVPELYPSIFFLMTTTRTVSVDPIVIEEQN